MNIEEYNLDTLRNLVRSLQEENKALREELKRNHLPQEPSDAFEKEGRHADNFDPDQGGRIQETFIDDKKANLFFSMFWGRMDVYAKRGRNGGYFPQCQNNWTQACPRSTGKKQSCNDCPQHLWKKLELWRIKNHLIGEREDGTDVIGIYPLLADHTCRLLVFDFDNHEKDAEKSDYANTDDEWKDEVDALRLIGKKCGIDMLTERSRSGRGAHIWIFFKQPIDAKLARAFGLLLLDKGASAVNLKSFKYYDRMYPSQDSTDGIGNLIALPLQGRALKDGNSAFIDEDWNAYPDQWAKLLSTKKLSLQDIQTFVTNWQMELTGQTAITAAETERIRPWKRKNTLHREDVIGILHIVLADGIYVDALNLKTRLQNQIRCMAAMDNPEYYLNQHIGRSNYFNFSMIYLGRDINGYIQIPRGLYETLLQKCKEADIPVDISNQRENGRPIRVKFNGELRLRQDLAAQDILDHDDGILSAATSFGKTVVCSYLIAERKVNTLILLESRSLIQQWFDELNKFLIIDEDPPTYQTKTGKIKRRESVIGTLVNGQEKTTGIIDIAMVGSVYKKGAFFDRLNSYGMVIMDECHHAASPQAEQILRRVNARYLYGVSATPMRSDNLQKINYMMLGPVRHTYTAKEQAREQNVARYVIPRFTRTVDLSNEETDIHKAYDLICDDMDRNSMIIHDVENGVKEHRTPVVLTKYKRQAKYLYDHLQGAADHIFLLYGDNTAKENDTLPAQMKSIPDSESLILVATGQKVGEGFDFPRLDTLMLAAPVAYSGRLTQYVGRIGRPYAGKTSLYVYDYVDAHIRMFDSQYNKRLAAYRSLGFRVESPDSEKQSAKAIYDAGNYLPVFEQDLIEANHEIIVASPDLRTGKVERFMNLVQSRQEKGVNVIVITRNPDETEFEDSSVLAGMIHKMQKNGIIVRCTEDESQHYAVIDKKLVWHGGMNLLGKEDVWDNLIRVNSPQAAAELLEISDHDIDQLQPEKADNKS